MSNWDAAYCLQMFDDCTRRPSTDESLSTALKYRLLTLAQNEVLTEVATHCPEAVVSEPQLMSTADSGATYTFGTDSDGEDIWPMGHVELYASTDGGELYWSSYGGGEGDVVLEGDRVRIPQGRTRSFTSGPYWRGVVPSEAIDAGTNPILKPKHARILIVYRAVEKWCALGGLRDPAWARDLYTRAWIGDPNTGEAGLLAMYKTQFAGTLSGAEWWRWWSRNIGAAGELLGSFADGSITADGGI